MALKAAPAPASALAPKTAAAAAAPPNAAAAAQAAAAAWHMQEQQRLALSDAQTHTQSQSYAPQSAPSTHHQGEFEVKRKAHGTWGLGGPPRPASPTPTTSKQPVLQPAQPGPDSAPPRPNTCSAEGIGPRSQGKGKGGRGPFLTSTSTPPLVGKHAPKF